MSYVIFKNKGVIDKRAITIMGLSSKDNPNPIGFFGTGLKYSIATLLRNNIDITIYAGTEELKLTSELVKFRNEEFRVISMNEQELGYATDLGKTWQIWQAFRELYSNCLDECGEIFETNSLVKPEEGHTTIIVRGGLFAEQFRNKGTIFIEDTEIPFTKSTRAEVYTGCSHGSVYYRKVKIKEQVMPLFKYNILDKIDLTEDRTAKYDFQLLAAIRDTIAVSGNADFIERCITAKDDYLETNINYMDSCTPSETFLEVVPKVREQRRFDLMESAWKLYQKHTQKVDNVEPLILTDFEKKQLFRACELAEKIGFPVREYPISTDETLGTNVLALAEHQPIKKILLSKELFTKGVKNLMRGIIEEYIHLRHGYDDCSLEMQNYLFDKMTHFGLESVGEAA